ncbi:hypothetical protein [Micromonospora sp. WMMD1082]|uniref:hypothetical protein n=1 Tax=Micromonospora sp. WMMD1082 TaxID=3016104 RepID=UPI0024164473|nr:hypothetical protein [Micromonospora sp. WMMD1082]MDG4798823.1 hypothetical protein [Micromonospora sp. WMMD1082]
MSRQELAEAVNAYLYEHAGRRFAIHAGYIGKLERGEHRWPSAHYRTALRAVLGRDTDAELGFYIIQGHASDDAAEVESDASGEAGAAVAGLAIAPPVELVAEAVAGVAVPDAGAGAAWQVNVSAQAGTAVTVVCQDGAAGRVAVLAGGVRVLIDAAGTGPASLAPAVLDVAAVPGSARVYSLVERRAR